MYEGFHCLAWKFMFAPFSHRQAFLVFPLSHTSFSIQISIKTSSKVHEHFHHLLWGVGKIVYVVFIFLASVVERKWKIVVFVWMRKMATILVDTENKLTIGYFYVFLLSVTWNRKMSLVFLHWLSIRWLFMINF